MGTFNDHPRGVQPSGWKRGTPKGDDMVCSIWKHIAVRKNGDGLANRPEHKVKRACFKWGLGRELYTAPFIWIRKQFCNLQQQGGKWTCYDHFRVQSMETDNGRITYLQIVNESTSCIAYEWRA